MLPQSLLGFIAALVFPLIAAASTPSCQPSNYGADLSNFNSNATQFCTKLSNENFTSDIMMYGFEQKTIISFQFTPQNGTSTTCNLNACSAGVSALATACAKDSHTIYGSGSTDLGCGTCNFTITPQTTPTSATTPAATASQTGKPNVGNAALGNSGTSIVRGSGYTIVGVACIFALLL